MYLVKGWNKKRILVDYISCAKLMIDFDVLADYQHY